MQASWHPGCRGLTAMASEAAVCQKQEPQTWLGNRDDVVPSRRSYRRAPEAVDAHLHAPPAGRLPARHQPARMRPRLQHVHGVAALGQVPSGAQPCPEEEGTAVNSVAAPAHLLLRLSQL